MKLLAIALLLFAAPAALSPFALAQDAAPGMVGQLELLEAAGPPVEARTATQTLQLHTGDSVKAGERLTVPKGQSALVRMADSSEVTLSPGTVAEWVMVTPPGEGTTKYAEIVLEQGLAHAAVQSGYSKAHPFLIRTPVAALGVRGTEFVVEHEPGAATSSLYTIHGSVALARSREELAQDRAVLVVAGQTSSHRAGGAGPTAPRRFELARLKARLEGMAHGLIERIHYHEERRRKARPIERRRRRR